MRTITIPEQANYTAVDGTEIRLLLSLDDHGSIAHGTLPAKTIAQAITHQTVFETWFILSGHGTMWRRYQDQERVDELSEGMIIDLPLGTEYQFASDAEPLVFVIVTMPPWPGAGEACLLADQDWSARLAQTAISQHEGVAPLLAKKIPADYEHMSPAGAEIRLLSHSAIGDVVHCTLRQGLISQGVTHKTVSEFWFVLAGEGQIWRRVQDNASVTDLVPGVCIDIPLGTEFQYRAGTEDLVFLCITMPPWSGADEARYLDDACWQPTESE